MRGRRVPMKNSPKFPKKGSFKKTRQTSVVIPPSKASSHTLTPLPPSSNRVLFLCSVFCSRALKDYLTLTNNGFDVYVGSVGGRNKHLEYVKEGRSIVYTMAKDSIKNVINNVKPAIIHVHNSPNIPAVWARSFFSGPIILDIHDSRTKDQQKAMDLVDHIFTVHDDYADKIKKQFKVKKDIIGVPSVYWIDFEPEDRFDDGEIHLCFIGSMYTPITANKWCGMFKEMANRLHVHIHIHVNYFHDIVRKYQDDYVHLEEQIPFMEIPKVLSKYDAGLLPSGSAMSLPNKFFDYVNAGIPIIADPNRALVSSYVKKYDIGAVISLDKLQQDDITTAIDKRDNVDYKRIEGIKTVVQLKPYLKKTRSMPLKKMGTIIQTKMGSCIIDNIHFYDYTATTAKKGYLNIPYIRDLPSVQCEQAKYTKARIDSFFKKFKGRVQNIHAFITMTNQLADHTRALYGINVPHGLFRAYPDWMETPKEKRREIVYIDNSGSMPFGFLEHLTFLDKITKETGIPTMFVSKKFNAKSKAVIKEHSLDVSCSTKAGYDYGSEFGILMNTNNFNQAGEALNRKLLTYLMCGMKPLADDSFTASIEFVRSCDIEPYIYDGAKDAANAVNHKFGEIDRRYFSMQERVADLASELERLSK